jgi:hypothetical protein
LPDLYGLVLQVIFVCATGKFLKLASTVSDSFTLNFHETGGHVNVSHFQLYRSCYMIFVLLGFVDNDLQVKGLKRPLDKQSLCKLDFNLLEESKAMSSIDPVLFLASIQEGFSDRKRRL